MGYLLNLTAGLLLLTLLSGCSTNNKVVSNLPIAKRKYTKGYYLANLNAHKKALRSKKKRKLISRAKHGKPPAQTTLNNIKSVDVLNKIASDVKRAVKTPKQVVFKHISNQQYLVITETGSQKALDCIINQSGDPEPVSDQTYASKSIKWSLIGLFPPLAFFLLLFSKAYFGAYFGALIVYILGGWLYFLFVAILFLCLYSTTNSLTNLFTALKMAAKKSEYTGELFLAIFLSLILATFMLLTVVVIGWGFNFH